jgi:hypothetical protein
LQVGWVQLSLTTHQVGIRLPTTGPGPLPTTGCQARSRQTAGGVQAGPTQPCSSCSSGKYLVSFCMP